MRLQFYYGLAIPTSCAVPESIFDFWLLFVGLILSQTRDRNGGVGLRPRDTQTRLPCQLCGTFDDGLLPERASDSVG
jgi:hypothetical protein